MGEQDREEGGSIPSWQQAASSTPSDSDATALEQARIFLQDESVRESTREKKVEFLKSKGLGEADINTLLEETDAVGATTTTTTTQHATKLEPRTEPAQDSTRAVSTPEFRADQPPIITYPEFLTKPAKPPPLITASGLVNSLGIVAGLSTFVYGATKYLVSPMVDTLTDARVEFHENANKNLSQLVEKLEHAVSEIPESYHTAGKKAALTSTHAAAPYTDAGDDDASSYDDPTELFHRDVGVQTSPPSTPGLAGGLSYPTADSTGAGAKHSSMVTAQQQADKMGRLISSIRDLSTDLASQADGFGETKNVLDDFGRDLHTLTYPPESFGVSSSYLYGAARNEPDDEIKKVKNNIRSVKGVLLSTRSFAAPTR
ncbi:hypothetical protein N8I77_006358 [Diaporthe amygdali]|uniref:Peroxisomal membrane protein PEX14 n=1 Tax=Phomopsis amygdali TaxID=1214568 RepID=A0AAD9SGV4_PHOAM|nr:hypothetical protein N8I77_006358 [Diaporthe amygdali]